ncbi:MAG: protein BatD [Magnetococcales bacterium]|nr:protein BatD [Magnetococcales bacterium]
MVKRTLMALWLFMALFPQLLMAMEIQVRASRNPVSLTESFTLTFEAQGGVDGDPDFSPLEKDFDILGRNQSSSFQFINGVRGHSVTWSLELMAKRAGTLTIPAILFGKERTAPVVITVEKGHAVQPDPAGGDPEGILLEVEATPSHPYVQEQVILTIRFLRGVEILNASLTEPRLSTGEGVLEKLGEDRNLEVTRGNRRYRAIERSYALFPQSSGQMVLAPVTLTAQLPGSGGGSPLSDFLNTPFFSNIPQLGRPGRTVRVVGKPIEWNIQPARPDFAGQWLPARRLLLSEKWSPDPPTFRVGEPVTRVLTLQADGLTAAQLPALPERIPDGLRAYPDRPALEELKSESGVVGKRMEKIALIPNAPGSFRLPALEISWWNTETKSREIARLPERDITVLPGTQPTPSPAPAPVVEPPRTDAPAKPMLPVPVATGESGNGGGYWPWVALLFALAWLTTLGLWWWRGGRARMGKAACVSAGEGEDGALPLRRAMERVRIACQAHDPVAARAALAALPVPLPDSPRLEREMYLLNTVLFSANPPAWRGDGLWEAAREALRLSSVAPSSDMAVLPPLYPA